MTAHDEICFFVAGSSEAIALAACRNRSDSERIAGARTSATCVASSCVDFVSLRMEAAAIASTCALMAMAATPSAEKAVAVWLTSAASFFTSFVNLSAMPAAFDKPFTKPVASAFSVTYREPRDWEAIG